MRDKILIVNDRKDMGKSYLPAFRFVGGKTEDIDQARLVLFTGGSDVHPSLYGEKPNRRCYFDRKRDREELEIFEEAKRKGVPMFGVCRGAQFLCVMTGGKLVQHCTGHNRSHPIELADGRRFDVSSSHHQMMIPGKNSETLGWAQPKLSKEYLNGNDENIDYIKEVEVAAFPEIRSFGVQYHPEVMWDESDGYKYCKELIEKLI